MHGDKGAGLHAGGGLTPREPLATDSERGRLRFSTDPIVGMVSVK
jgi:hypothetical protein